MAKKKQRTVTHIMEDDSKSVFRNLLPKEWVIHDYKPDYGIDNVVEIFKYTDKNKQKAETLGELFFVQLKSVKKTKVATINVYPRYNVEKAPLLKQKTKKGSSKKIDIIKFTIETSELLTIQSMGTSIPVLLVLVTLDTKKAYFICLSDLIDKVIIPHDNNYTDKKTKTICIPIKNEIKDDYGNLIPLRFYAKRPKLYSAFMKFEYQSNELNYILPINFDELSDISRNTILHFITILKRLDIWHDCEMWKPIKVYYNELCGLEKTLQSLSNENIVTFMKRTNNFKVSEIDLAKSFFLMNIESLWQRLKSLSHVYEELCREWFLPTHLSGDLSYQERKIFI